MRYFNILFLSLSVAFPSVVTARLNNVPAPLLEGISIYSQHKVALNDHLGKVVLIDFWASWCVPCRRALPALNQLREQYKKARF